MSPRTQHAHECLDAYRLSRELALDLYRVTSTFPREERYGLVAQIRRAAISVPANIAEGAARRTHGEFSRFVAMARGSVSELDVLLEISQAIGYLTQEGLEHQQRTLDRLYALTSGLIRRAEVGRLERGRPRAE